MFAATPGLLLQAIPYLGEKKILKIFTPEKGLISLLARKTSVAPFSLAEWVYRSPHQELHPLQEAALLDPLLHLRASYPVLCAAGAIAQDLLKTQMPNKSAPELFDLTLLYLRKLSISPRILAASFRLKLLYYEGLLSVHPDPMFSTSEWERIETLAFGRKVSDIQAAPDPPYPKIDLLFKERFHL